MRGPERSHFPSSSEVGGPCTGIVRCELARSWRHSASGEPQRLALGERWLLRWITLPWTHTVETGRSRTLAATWGFTDVGVGECCWHPWLEAAPVCPVLTYSVCEQQTD